MQQVKEVVFENIELKLNESQLYGFMKRLVSQQFKLRWVESEQGLKLEIIDDEYYDHYMIFDQKEYVYDLVKSCVFKSGKLVFLVKEMFFEYKGDVTVRSRLKEQRELIEKIEKGKRIRVAEIEEGKERLLYQTPSIEEWMGLYTSNRAEIQIENWYERVDDCLDKLQYEIKKGNKEKINFYKDLLNKLHKEGLQLEIF